MVHRCMIKSGVMWLHISVGSLFCVYVALFRSRLFQLSVTLASTDNELHEEGVSALKHAGAILM